jgi:hypothetical protein
MTPILGIMASQISGKLWQPDGAYDSLATVTVPSGGLASITFAGIPNTYKHLQIRILARGTNASNEIAIVPQINGVTGNNYTQHGIFADGSSVVAAGSINDNAVIQRFPGASATASIFGTAIVDFVDYTNVNKKPVMRALGGVDRNGGGAVGFYSTMIQTNGAITQLTFAPNLGNFAEYSQFSLYGVR